MAMKPYVVLGYATLIFDIYLVLGSVAVKMMKSQYRDYLPLFGSEGVGDLPQFAVLVIATWTGLLAMGCVRSSSPSPSDAQSSSTLWFGLVLFIVWTAYLVPYIWQSFA